MALSNRVRAELLAAGTAPTLRALFLRRGMGLGTEQREALMAGRAVVLQTEWLASHYREDQHPSFPPSFGASPAWRLEADGDTLTPVS